MEHGPGLMTNFNPKESMIARYLAVGLCAGMVSLSTYAQSSLASMVSQESMEWMFGQWQAQSENGETVTLNVQWDLDKHVAVLHVKAGEMESKGYTILEPDSEYPKYYAFDNRGGVSKGSWDLENGELVLRTESQRSDRGPFKTGFIFSGSASIGLKVSMHTIDSYGGLVSPARVSFNFKKKT